MKLLQILNRFHSDLIVLVECGSDDNSADPRVQSEFYPRTHAAKNGRDSPFTSGKIKIKDPGVARDKKREVWSTVDLLMILWWDKTLILRQRHSECCGRELGLNRHGNTVA